jgi:signal transduction histidine kinase
MRRRVIVCLGLLLALCLLGDVIAMLSLRGSIQQLRALAQSHEIQTMRVDLTSNSVRIETDLMAYLSGYAHGARRYQDSIQRFETSLNRCNVCHHAREVQEQLDEIRADYAAYVQAGDRLFTKEDMKVDSALEQEVKLLADRLSAEATAMSDQAAHHVSVRSHDAATSIRNAWLILLGTLLLALVAGGTIALHLKSRLTRPVEALLDGVERLRRGDHQHRFSLTGDEEFRRLAEAFNHAYENVKKAEHGIYQAEKMAAVGRLAAGVAHEVGNPLASLSSIAQMMRRKGQSPEQAARIDLMMQQIERISTIVRNLLSFSRHGVSERRNDVDIARLLERAAVLMSYDKRAKNVRIVKDFQHGLSGIPADLDRLLLVFTNIILNAFDALGSYHNGPPELRICLRQEDGEIRVKFTDNGVGMSEEQLASAIDPFFTTKEPGEGTGLGLWICYEVIRDHGGTIRLTSSVQEGTEVEIRLPCEAIETPPATRNSKSSGEQTTHTDSQADCEPVETVAAVVKEHVVSDTAEPR